MKHKLLILFLACFLPVSARSQRPITVEKIHRQHAFPHTVPAGNYSGITAIDDSTYAVVDDKSQQDGFHLFRICIDSLSGDISDVRHLSFVGNGKGNRDSEGIVYCPATKTLFISGERDNCILEYTLDGEPTGRQLAMPPMFHSANHNAGLESLAYDTEAQTFWTTTENPLPHDSLLTLRLQSFDRNLHPQQQLFYRMQPPEKRRKARFYAHGVSELTALPDGRLLVLEREFFVPKRKIGSSVTCKLFLFAEGQKTLLCRWRTRLNLTRRSFANYEGMCLGPRLANGQRVLLLVADSQAQYGGILKDHFRTIVLSGI